jgi:hypothetical protein
MAFAVNNSVISAYVQSLGAVVPPGVTRLFGVRGAIPHGAGELSLQPNTLNLWNDTIGIWGNDFALYQGTVDPGLDYTIHPTNDLGAAHLITLEEPRGKVWHFQWGMHKGQYPCLVQAESFLVRRDKNRDGIAQLVEPIEGGDFGIHIHYGGVMKKVGAWSAGCQVLKGGSEANSPWVDFVARLKKSGQSQFAYFLIDGAALAKHLGA